jgi:UDP-glucuronate decarboxylase
MQFQDGRVVSNFIMQALGGEDLTIYGDGSQTRSFCYVSDLTEGLIAAITSDTSVTGPINLGNPTELTILQLAQTIIRLTGSNSKISSLPLPSDDPKQRKPDISKAISTLNWSPKIDLETGLTKTIEDFRNRLANLHTRN